MAAIYISSDEEGEVSNNYANTIDLCSESEDEHQGDAELYHEIFVEQSPDSPEVEEQPPIQPSVVFIALADERQQQEHVQQQQQDEQLERATQLAIQLSLMETQVKCLLYTL